jgi:ribulose-phosphate 3-epimerase
MFLGVEFACESTGDTVQHFLMPSRDRFVQLKEAAPLILPSFLQCDFGNLEREVRSIEAADVRALHLDVMDGHFVPNLTYGMPIVAALHRLSDLPLDVHLMIANPEQYVDAFVEAGADCVTVHIEAHDEIPAVLDRIQELGAAAGIAINPDTPMRVLEPCVGRCDLVLVMSVQAGFGGQSFNEVALAKLRTARGQFGEDVILQIDGGINADTLRQCTAAGAEMLVVGSAIFQAPDYRAAVQQLRQLAVYS